MPHCANSARQMSNHPFSWLLTAVVLVAPPCWPAATVINFENLAAPGYGTGGLVLKDQMAAQGIVFDHATAFDYSRALSYLTSPAPAARLSSCVMVWNSVRRRSTSRSLLRRGVSRCGLATGVH